MISDTITTVAGNIAVFAGGTAYRLSSDLVTDRDRLTAGQFYYSIAWAYTGKDRARDSNISYYGYQLTVWIRHRLTTPNNEQPYLVDNTYSAEKMLRALGDPAFWLAGPIMAGTNPDIYDFQSGSDSLVLTAPEREGNIISFSAVAKLLLKN